MGGKGLLEFRKRKTQTLQSLKSCSWLQTLWYILMVYQIAKSYIVLLSESGFIHSEHIPLLSI